MENEENRGLINKKAYEDQWARLGQFSFGALSLFSLSLSYSWLLRILLDHSWRVWHTWILGARRQRKSSNTRRHPISLDFLTVTELHVLFLH